MSIVDEIGSAVERILVPPSNSMIHCARCLARFGLRLHPWIRINAVLMLPNFHPFPAAHQKGPRSSAISENPWRSSRCARRSSAEFASLTRKLRQTKYTKVFYGARVSGLDVPVCVQLHNANRHGARIPWTSVLLHAYTRTLCVYYSFGGKMGSMEKCN